VNTAGGAVTGIVVARIHSTVVVIVARIENVQALTRGRVARVEGTQNTVIAVYGDRVAVSGIAVAQRW